METPKFELDLDSNMRGFLKWRCPQCSRNHRYALGGLPPGAEKQCECGYVVLFSGDDLRKMQRSLNDLHRILRSLGRK